MTKYFTEEKDGKIIIWSQVTKFDPFWGKLTTYTNWVAEKETQDEADTLIVFLKGLRL